MPQQPSTEQHSEEKAVTDRKENDVIAGNKWTICSTLKVGLLPPSLLDIVRRLPLGRVVYGWRIWHHTRECNGRRDIKYGRIHGEPPTVLL